MHSRRNTTKYLLYYLPNNTFPMNRLFVYCNFIFIAVILLNSCTIKRRTFNKGFHVEWKRELSSLPSKLKNDQGAYSIDSTSNSFIHKSSIYDSIIVSEHSIPEMQSLHLSSDTNLAHETVSTHPVLSKFEIAKTLDKPTVSEDDPDEDYYHKPTGPVNPLAIISFALAMFSILFVLVLSFIAGGELIIIGLIPSIGTIITGAFSLHYKRKHPNSRLSGFGITGFVLGILLAALLVILATFVLIIF